MGVIVARACAVSDRMLAAAAEAVGRLADPSLAEGSLLPPVRVLRTVSLAVASAVARAAADEGLARTALTDVEGQIRQAIWEPQYGRVVPAG